MSTCDRREEEEKGKRGEKEERERRESYILGESSRVIFRDVTLGLLDGIVTILAVVTDVVLGLKR